MLAYGANDQVYSERFGIGSVLLDNGPTVIVRFGHGIEECERSKLRRVLTPLQSVTSGEWHPPLEVITKVQAEAIQSVNDTWGVFALSRIALLPHQLWVCRHVVETWPTRWLVADDVGLGKTIEAGLILSALLSRGAVSRILILCPASLVDQWIHRLRTMFDIRFTRYTAESDTPRADFWNTHNQVVASLQTLRADHRGRHERLFESEPWDILIVDEAHHLNADEKSGPTLGYRLVQQLVEERLVRSEVFFTGTPHRGKTFGFLSLLSLLRPDLFNAQESLGQQLPHLCEVMIRNNKQNVTDLKGQRLFKPPIVTSETFAYSAPEDRFYSMLTEFILSGKAYASSLGSQDSRAVMLVLIAMQKLASSSVAAIRRALKGRLARILEGREQLDELRHRLARYEELEQLGAGDETSELEEQIAELSAELRLMENEVPRLEQLIAVAELVKEETKIAKIISILRAEFVNRPVLFFTEYKATQSLLMSALIREFGNACVTFINGDNRADEVVDEAGKERSIYEDREAAAERFTSGEVRFLISTEAGGEGIDLQEQCHTLIHVDLPWNPMRLHQRVGRLNRYGQHQQVEVMTLRNPDTVESIIWDRLNQKIRSITLALGQVMDEPEDLLQLVLGMTSPSFFREVFAEAHTVPRRSLGDWFDQKTARFGGRDAIETVRDLVGNSVTFDFQQVSSQLPRVDLPALRSFVVTMLTLNGRRSQDDSDGLSFITPEVWLDEPGIRRRYHRMVFDRQDQSKDAAQRILGVGHRVVDHAIRQAKASSASIAALPAQSLGSPIFAFRISDRVTSESRVVRSIVAGIELDLTGKQSDVLLRDWELLARLNELADDRRGKRTSATEPVDASIVEELFDRAGKILENQLEQLELPFLIPYVEGLAILWPSA